MDQDLKIKVSLDDRTRGGLSKISKSLGDVGSRAKQIGHSFKYLSAAAAAGIAGSLKSFAELEQKMSNVATLISGDSTKMIGDLTDGVRDLAVELGQSHNALADSMYDIVSAGIPAAEAVETLGEATKLSMTGVAQITTATDVLTSALNAFTSQNLEAAEAAAILQLGVKYGKSTIEDLGAQFGSVAPLMESLGVKFRIHWLYICWNYFRCFCF